MNLFFKYCLLGIIFTLGPGAYAQGTTEVSEMSQVLPFSIDASEAKSRYDAEVRLSRAEHQEIEGTGAFQGKLMKFDASLGTLYAITIDLWIEQVQSIQRISADINRNIDQLDLQCSHQLRIDFATSCGEDSMVWHSTYQLDHLKRTCTPEHLRNRIKEMRQDDSSMVELWSEVNPLNMLSTKIAETVNPAYLERFTGNGSFTVNLDYQDVFKLVMLPDARERCVDYVMTGKTSLKGALFVTFHFLPFQ